MGRENDTEDEFNRMVAEETVALEQHSNFMGRSRLDLLIAIEGVRNGLSEASRLADVAQEDAPDDEELKNRKIRARAKLRAIMDIEKKAREGIDPEVLANHHGEKRVEWEKNNPPI